MTTQSLTTNHHSRELGAAQPAHLVADRDPQGTDFGELLEQVRESALRFVTEAPRTPQALRIRAGAVSVEIEWADEPADGTVLPVPVGPASTEGDPVGRPVTAPDRRLLTAPTVGVFYRAPEPGAPPFVTVGDTVSVGQQVGIVEAMKLMIPVEAESAGRIAEVLKGDGEPVEYGEPLFALDPVESN